MVSWRLLCGCRTDQDRLDLQPGTAEITNGHAGGADVSRSAVKPLAGGARPGWSSVILPGEVQRTMESSARVSPMRDMLPAGRFILVLKKPSELDFKDVQINEN